MTKKGWTDQIFAQIVTPSRYVLHQLLHYLGLFCKSWLFISRHRNVKQEFWSAEMFFFSFDGRFEFMKTRKWWSTDKLMGEQPEHAVLAYFAAITETCTKGRRNSVTMYPRIASKDISNKLPTLRALEVFIFIFTLTFKLERKFQYFFWSFSDRQIYNDRSRSMSIR